MTDLNLTQKIIDQLDHLPLVLQRKVLDFAQALSLTQPKGISGRDLLSFAGCIEKEDLKLIEQAVKDHCERIDPDEW